MQAQLIHEDGKIKPLVSFRELEFLLGWDRASLQRIADTAGRFYRPFDRRVGGEAGKWRHIDNPIGPLKEIQNRILSRLLQRLLLPPNMLGGRSGLTVLDNARLHLAAPYLLRLDLRACFPSTHDLRVYRAFIEKLGCSPDIASLLTKLTTFQHRLPQGAPTSSMIANMTLVDLFYDIERLTIPENLALTFWVDDIAISGGENIRCVIDPAIRLIGHHGHSAARKKVKFMPNHVHQQLTGMTLNRKPSAGSSRIATIERLIFDLADRDVVFDDELKAIAGKISFVGYINECQGRLLSRLRDRYLPNSGVARITPRKDERRSCGRTRRHRIERQVVSATPAQSRSLCSLNLQEPNEREIG